MSLVKEAEQGEVTGSMGEARHSRRSAKVFP